MKNFKKWIHKYDDNGFINKEREKLEKILMISAIIVIAILFLSLIIWTIIESKKTV